MTDSLRHDETIMQERLYGIAPSSIYWHDTSNDLMDTKKIHKRKAEVVEKKVVSAKFELREHSYRAITIIILEFQPDDHILHILREKMHSGPPKHGSNHQRIEKGVYCTKL